MGVNNSKVNQRYSVVDTLCKKCNKIEDEFHFLIDCVLYDTLRDKHLVCLLEKFKGPNRADLLARILSDHNADTVRHVAMFVYYAFIEREVFYSTFSYAKKKVCN
jgi:hypothetical protein